MVNAISEQITFTIQSASLTPNFPAIFGVLPLPRLRDSAPQNTAFQCCSCLYNGKFTVTTFKSRFSRCLNCLESLTRADNTPKMADIRHREKR
jgi:hypothetical protein